MGSCAAPSAKGDDKFITTDYLQQCRFHPCATGKDRKGYASTSAAVFPFQAHNAEPSGKSWSDRHSLRVQPASPAAHGN
ncbi:hypothetical protein CS370_15615 (plasmid) [Serratia marcescens]|nr:hypothetical protein CS370_15615 [Serratia marcescens]